MQNITVKLETITPLFLGEAAPRGEPELRPPAFRGALRYWLRVALGGVIGDNDTGLKKIRSAESLIFGSAGGEQDNASALVMRKHGEDLKLLTFSEIAEKFSYKNEEGQTKTGFHKPGIVYLLFAARETKKEKERSAIIGEFNLTFALRPGTIRPNEVLKQVYISLWLLTRLGGLGSRARRGAGNLSVTDIRYEPDFAKELPLIVHAKTPEQLAEELKNGLQTIKKWIEETQTIGKVNSPSRFDILHPQSCEIAVIDKPYNNWKDALEELGKIYRDFRNRREPDYSTVKKSIKNGINLGRPIERAAFGMPVPFLFNSLKRIVDDNQSLLQTEHYDRRASPLIFRVVRLASRPTKQYAIVVVWFHSEFLPNNEQLKLVHDKNERFGNSPNEDLIDLFLQKCISKQRFGLNRGEL